MYESDGVNREYITRPSYEKENTTYEKGVVVIPAYLAKGIEFDAVIIFDASHESYYRSLNAIYFTQHVRGRCMNYMYIMPGS